jgi:hypothetical protein
VTPPEIELLPGTLRVKRSGALKLTVSKVSTVTVTVLRRGDVVLARTLRLSGGRHTVAIRPLKAVPLDVRLRAVDLAGNAATVDGQVDVEPARKG